MSGPPRIGFKAGDPTPIREVVHPATDAAPFVALAERAAARGMVCVLMIGQTPDGVTEFFTYPDWRAVRMQLAEDGYHFLFADKGDED